MKQIQFTNSGQSNVGKFACDIPATVTKHGQVSRYGFEKGFTQTVRQGGDYLVIRMNDARDQFQVEGMVDNVGIAVYGLTALCRARMYVCEQFGKGAT